MLRRRVTSAATVGVDIMVNAAKLVFVNQLRTIASPPSPANLRPPSPSTTTTRSMNTNHDPHLHHLFQQKHSLRSKIRTRLKNMDPVLKSQEDDAIQQAVLEAPWFKSSSSICAYISSDALREVDTSRVVSNILSNPATEGQGHIQMKKTVFLPRVEDKNSNMRMLKISSYDDLVLSSMNILEPTVVDCNGNPREDAVHFAQNFLKKIGLGKENYYFWGQVGKALLCTYAIIGAVWLYNETSPLGWWTLKPRPKEEWELAHLYEYRQFPYPGDEEAMKEFIAKGGMIGTTIGPKGNIEADKDAFNYQEQLKDKKFEQEAQKLWMRMRNEVIAELQEKGFDVE